MGSAFDAASAPQRTRNAPTTRLSWTFLNGPIFWRDCDAVLSEAAPGSAAVCKPSRHELPQRSQAADWERPRRRRGVGLHHGRAAGLPRLNGRLNASDGRLLHMEGRDRPDGFFAPRRTGCARHDTQQHQHTPVASFNHTGLHRCDATAAHILRFRHSARRHWSTSCRRC